jgi:hypothetical protein
VTEHGLTWCFLLRTGSVAWADVHDVKVVSGLGGFATSYSPGVATGTGLIGINSVAGPQKYIGKVVAGILDARPAGTAHTSDLASAASVAAEAASQTGTSEA